MSLILAAIWAQITAWFLAFWPWIAGVASAILAFLWSPAIRKYTIEVIIILAIVASAFTWGYTSNHTIQTITHTCNEFRKVIVTGPVTDKAIAVFKRHGLCQ